MSTKNWPRAAVLVAAASLGCSRAAAEGPASPLSPQAPASNDALRRGFMSPPQDARPRVWWHWINGNVSLEGAKLDLEWMQRVGIGGVHTFSGGLPGPVVVPKRQPFMSKGWNEAFRETTRLANAAGMEVGIAGSPGWSHTGGPWVERADAMKKYVWSETRVTNGRAAPGPLPAPPAVTGPFQGLKRGGKQPQMYGDALVIAYPTPALEKVSAIPTLSSSAGDADLAPIFDADLATRAILPLSPSRNEAWIEARFPRRTAISAITLALPAGAEVEIQAGNDGKPFRTVARSLIESQKILTHPTLQQTIAIPRTLAERFRVILKPIAQPASLPTGPGAPPAPPPPPARVEIAKLVFSTGARVNRFEAKAGFQPSLGLDDLSSPPVSRNGVVAAQRVIDLTDKLRSDGRLDWMPPKGDWTILRFGWSLTGQTNGPAEPEATGLEVDKLDPDAVRRYLNTHLGTYEQAVGGTLAGAGVQTLITDSWEAGVQNWTPGLVREFRIRRGYDPLPYMPILAGRIVESAEASDRFLWDFRQTLKDMVADNHHGVLAAMLHARGLRYYTEVQGDTPRAIADAMTLKARSDIPTAEYWYRPFAAGPGQLSLKADLEEAASAAHVYGKPFAAAEALTVAAAGDPWAFSPRMLKPVADEIFARGINRFLIHDSHHQPLPDAKPGLMMMMFGQFFNRNDTWAEDAKPWVDYLARTSFMLQQGRFVADVAYFYGEEKTPTELFGHRLNTDVPDGYRYDYINPEALLTLLSVEDGQVATASGMRYRLLFLPPHVTRLTLPAMRKLRDLVQAGAILVGEKPVGGLGLGSPDAEVLRVADSLWSNHSKSTAGRGRVYTDLPAALAGERILPDVSFSGRQGDSDLLTLHRRTADNDIYFISNQQARPENLDATFRVTGKAPELWRAETGIIEPLTYRQSDRGTSVPLQLAPHEAIFVVFSRKTSDIQWTARAPSSKTVATLEGPWTVTFEPGRGAPAQKRFEQLISWPDVADPGIKYFSGSGTYNSTVAAPRAWFERGRRFLLDLGEVRELASVTVNGKLIGTVWHPPYRVDITSALRPGKNLIAVRVVNLWPNRLIGDKQAAATTIAFAPQARYKANSPLLPSGLLGPVRLVTTTGGSE